MARSCSAACRVRSLAATAARQSVRPSSQAFQLSPADLDGHADGQHGLSHAVVQLARDTVPLVVQRLPLHGRHELPLRRPVRRCGRPGPGRASSSRRRAGRCGPATGWSRGARMSCAVPRRPDSPALSEWRDRWPPPPARRPAARRSRRPVRHPRSSIREPSPGRCPATRPPTGGRAARPGALDVGRQAALVVDQLAASHRHEPGARGRQYPVGHGEQQPVGPQVRRRRAHHPFDQRAGTGRGAYQGREMPSSACTACSRRSAERMYSG